MSATAASCPSVCAPYDLSLDFSVYATCAAGRLMHLSDSAWTRGRPSRGLALMEEAFRQASVDSSCDCRDSCRISLAIALTSVRELARAHELLYTDAPPAEPDELLAVTAKLSLSRAYLAATVGRLDIAASFSERGLTIARGIGLRPWLPIGHLVLLTVALRQVDMKSASVYMQRLSEDSLLGRSPRFAGQCAWATAQLREAQNGADDAVQFIGELVDLGPVSRELLISQPAAAPWLARVALSVNDRDTACQGLDAARRVAAINPRLPSVAAAAVHVKGLVEQNLDDLRHAVEAHTDPWARASAMEDVGTHLAGIKSQQDQAVEILERASDAYFALGASRDFSRVKSRLRSLNVRHHSSRWHRRPRTSVRDLTETEFAVAQLVAQGLTNSQAAAQLFLSSHTVAFHLRKIFSKLEVTSRVELARVWGATVGRG